MYRRCPLKGASYGDKHILSETSFARPALVRLGSGSSDSIALAWTGTDRSHRLNVLVGNPGHGYTKLTLNQMSFTAPSLAMNGGVSLSGVDRN